MSDQDLRLAVTITVLAFACAAAGLYGQHAIWLLRQRRRRPMRRGGYLHKEKR